MGTAGVRALSHRLPGQHTLASMFTVSHHQPRNPKESITYIRRLLTCWSFPIEYCVPCGEAAAVYAAGDTEGANGQ